MRVLGVDFRGQAGTIIIIHRKSVSRMIMEDGIFMSVSHKRTQICREWVWKLVEMKKKAILHSIKNTAKKEQHITR